MSIFAGALAGQTLAGTTLAGTTLGGITLEGTTLHETAARPDPATQKQGPCQSEDYDSSCGWQEHVWYKSDSLGVSPRDFCDMAKYLPYSEGGEGCSMAETQKKWPYTEFKPVANFCGQGYRVSKAGGCEIDPANPPVLKQDFCDKGYVNLPGQGCVRAPSPAAPVIGVESSRNMIIGAVVVLGVVAALVASQKKKTAQRWELRAMYAGFGAAALLSPTASLRRDPAVGARLSRLRAFWPSSTYLSAIAPVGFAAAEADPRAGLEALVNQVLDANAEARAAIARTGQSLTVSSSKAKAALAAIQAWRNDNAAELDALAKLPADTVVPENLRLRLPPDEARAFVSALWYDATVGIGLYETGFAMRAMEQGDPEWNPEQIRADLTSRLQSYRLLLAMDAEGSLAPALSGQGAPAGGVSGLGITWQVGLLIFGIVVAVVGLLMYFANRGYETWARWQRYDSLCDAAKKSGDSATIKACQETVTNIPQPIDPANMFIMVAGGVAFAFLFTNFVLPKWFNR